MSQLTVNNGRWELVGDVDVDLASRILQESNLLTLQEFTEVDFAKVSDIDTSAISLILEWKRRAHSENKRLNFINLPKSLLSLAKLYGVEEIII
jgi:phospholipid transport system transporter-binding protein